MNSTSVRDIIDRLHEEPDATLRTIKNSLTGHELRKIEYIEAGLLPSLDEYLHRYTRWTGKGSDDTEDAIWANAASVISVLANTGPAFTQPIVETNLIDALLTGFRASTTASKSTLAILNCLNNIADNLPLSLDLGPGKAWRPYQSFSNFLYQKDNVARLVRVIDAHTQNFSRQVSTASMDIICKTCTDERHRAMLLGCGLLGALEDQLSLISEEMSDSRRFERTSDTGDSARHDHLSLVLHCICLVTETSKAQAEQFVQCEGAKRLFVSDVTLPWVPDPNTLHAARKSNFPPLGSPGLAVKKRTSSMRHDSAAMLIQDNDEEDHAEMLIMPWLLTLARESRGPRRVVAARLLAILKSHGLMHPVRARSMALLLVPALVDMIEARKPPKSSSASMAHAVLIPSTIALLVRDNEHLQDAAVDAKAIPRLAAALKANFESTQELMAGLWWPHKLDHKLTEGMPTCRLGPGGPSKQVRFDMQMREGLLQALASLAPTKDAYRKEICEQGALAQIIQALEPFTSSITDGVHGDTLVIHGNSAQTLVAACATVRALTRSVTALRTKLVDADVAKSVLRLLHTGEPEVRIAATMVMANLAHDFSPMKPSIAEYTVIRKLCEQAHSANARLRHESLFALKALVNNSTNRLKRQVVEELGPNWIKHLIATDPHDVPAGEVIGLVPRDYRKGSLARVSDDAQMEDADSATDLDAQDQEYTQHTLQQDLDIQAELLAFLRNLTTGEQPSDIINHLLEHIGVDDFIQILLDRLQTLKRRSLARKPNATSSPPPEIVEHSLYILAHLCAADQKYRSAICFNTTLMKQVAALLHSSQSSPSISCAVCWLITNLVYQTQTDGFDGTAARARELQKIGIVSQMRRMESNDQTPEVVERVKTALDCFGRLLDRS
ncbi:hypothetical protein LTR70_009939 [Exophiala xenobiotica]|uniref:Armadillo repeat-containing protein 8 n=1 Tax=Lithohypha guttulata TaxID=1690604 RepID=A0ABR0JVS6_9EURO|nr:hypothetical protein LTR24_009866 [Lithohypha guttulata]KAK5309845.1 hypothetical protein LTR70_009939 [Exophiala xenobiotica]